MRQLFLIIAQYHLRVEDVVEAEELEAEDIKEVINQELEDTIKFFYIILLTIDLFSSYFYQF
jgi:hypothetical protein